MIPIAASLLGQSENIKHFFNGIRFVRQQKLAQKKITWSWEPPYKLYPSSLKSLTMCPLRYVREDVHKAPGWELENVYKMEAGKYLHTMYQTEIQELEDFLWDKPDFTNYPEKWHKGLDAKVLEIWPEVPVICPTSFVSGRADAVLNIGGEPVVFDIKTTSVADVQKEMKPNPITKRKEWTGKWLENCWQTYIDKNLPKSEHKLQVMIYCHLMNKHRMYNKKIRKYGLGYLNLLMDAGTSVAEFEVYEDFPEEMEDRIELFLHHLGVERKRYLAGEASECTYPQCRAHHLKTKKELE